MLIFASSTVVTFFTPSAISALCLVRFQMYHLRAIVRENRAVPKDWGQPISFIFSALGTKLIRLTLVAFTRFPGFSLSRLTTPLVFGQGKP